MPGVDRLASQIGYGSAPFLSPHYEDSLFKPEGFAKASNFVWNTVKYTPTKINWTSTGGEYTLEMNAEKAILGDIEFIYTLSAITSSGANERFTDGGFFSIKKMELMVGNKVFWERTPYEFYLIDYPRLPESERQKIDRNSLLHASEIQRNIISQSSKEYRIKLPLPWETFSEFLNMNTMGRVFKIVLTMNSFADCTESTGAATTSFTISNEAFWVDTYYIEDAEMRIQTLQINTADGILNRVFAVQKHEKVAVASSSTSVSLKLDNINLFAEALIITLTLQSDRDTNYSKKYLNFQTCDDIEIKAGSLTILEKTPSEKFLKDTGNKWSVAKWSGEIASEIVYVIPFAPAYQAKNFCSGGQMIEGVGNTTLYLYWDSATSAAMYLDVHSPVNSLLQRVGGEFKLIMK